MYAVADSGATGQWLGTATLITAEFALAHRPLNEELGQRPRKLRVGLFAVPGPSPDEPEITEDAPPRSALGEVIDVARIRVVTEAPDLVLLDLATASTAPPVFVGEPRPEPTREEVVAALRAVLDATPPGRTVAPVASGPTFIGNPIHWFRIVFGWG